MSVASTLGGDRAATVTGLACAFGAFLSWGVFPIYFKLLSAVPAQDVLAHRIVWSVLLSALLITVVRRWRAVAAVLAAPRQCLLLAASGAALAINWGAFIWAVADGQVLQSSLGYFISPLISVALGVVILMERLRPLQWAAVGLVVAGVGYEIVAVGSMPWIALTLAISWGLYGLARKVAAADPLTGLFIELLFLAPLAAAWLVAAPLDGHGSPVAGDGRLQALLLLSGLVTVLPLLMYVAAARRISLSTLGLLQYVVPTGHFLLAVLAYGEPLTFAGVATFVSIWTAIGLYSTDALREHRRPNPSLPPNAGTTP